MAKALLHFIDGSLKVVEPEKAVAIWEVLQGREEPTDAQAKFLPNIRHVSIPPSYQPSDYRPITDGVMDKTPVKQAVRGLDDENSLHNGVLQGMSQAVPRGDR